jgi:hypothetical protein
MRKQSCATVVAAVSRRCFARRGEFVRGPQRGSRVGVAVDTQKHVSRKQNVGSRPQGKSIEVNWVFGV